MKIQNEEAVSPVIGVILMVAITVILAAVIAAFVFGLAGTTSTAKNVGLTVSVLPEDSTNAGEYYAAITINGGTDIPTLNDLVYSIDGGANWKDVSALSGGTSSAVGEFTVGRIVYTTDSVKQKTLQIKGIFDDGSEQILFTRSF